MTSSPSLLTRDVLTEVARHHFAQDWLPVPGASGKKPALRKWGDWARLARQGKRPAWEEIERAFRGERVVGVGHIIVAGRCVVDVDGPAGEEVLSAGPMPDAPEVVTQHGRHLYFAGAKSLPRYRDLGASVHLLGPGHYCELPPTSGKEWKRHVNGELPRLPSYLRRLVQQQTDALKKAATGATAPVAANTEAELARWQELLGQFSGVGPWRAQCPLHTDDKESFSVYRGCEDGRLIGRCHGGCGPFTLRTLGYRLGNRRVTQYKPAREAITAVGDGIAPTTRDALRWVVQQAETYGLDLTDSEGIGASYRQLAQATGLERVAAGGALSNGGRSIVRLLDSLRALGVEVRIGCPHSTGGARGRTTRIILPFAWVSGEAWEEV